MKPMGLIGAIGKQMQHPQGLLARVVFPVMTRATMGHARWTADLMNVQPGDHVLEVGFGNGANIELLAGKATQGKVFGVEVAATAMELAARKNEDALADGRVELYLVNPGEAFPLGEASVDKACTVATMYVIEEPAAVFAEMHRVLKPGGLAAVTFPVREKFMRAKFTRAEGFHFHELADLEAAFRAVGFTDTRTERNDSVRFGAHCMLGRKEAGQ